MMKFLKILVKFLKKKIESLIQPDVQFKDSYNFSLSFFLKPEMKLEELKTSEIEKISADVTKKDIDDFRDKVRKEYYSLESIEVADDKSIIDFEIVNFGDDQKKIFSQKEVRIDFNTKTEEETFLDLKNLYLRLKINQTLIYQQKAHQSKVRLKIYIKKFFLIMMRS